MSIKKILLAAAVAAFAFAALPALASAEIIADVEETHFTVHGGTTSLTAGGSTIACTTVTGTGEFDSDETKTGTIELTFHGCKSSGFNCQSAGQSSGTITTTEDLVFHLVTAVDASSNVEEGVLITPDEDGHFASFKCAFGLVSIEVYGNGIIGEITAPELEEASNEFTMNFEADPENAETQQYETTGETGETEWDLTAYINDAEHEEGHTAVQDGEGVMTFTNGGLGTLTPTEG